MRSLALTVSSSPLPLRDVVEERREVAASVMKQLVSEDVAVSICLLRRQHRLFRLSLSRARCHFSTPLPMAIGRCSTASGSQSLGIPVSLLRWGEVPGRQVTVRVL